MRQFQVITKENNHLQTQWQSNFGGSRRCPLTFAPLNYTNKYWLFIFLQWEMAINWVILWLAIISDWLCHPNNPTTSPFSSLNRTEIRPIGLCVGSIEVSVNIIFIQTHCHKKKKVINQLRHQHRRSCAFDQSRNQKREKICTQVQLSATQAASCSTARYETRKTGTKAGLFLLHEVQGGLN